MHQLYQLSLKNTRILSDVYLRSIKFIQFLQSESIQVFFINITTNIYLCYWLLRRLAVRRLVVAAAVPDALY